MPRYSAKAAAWIVSQQRIEHRRLVGAVEGAWTQMRDAYLDAGADQGMIASLVDMGVLPQSDLTALADLYPYVPDVADLQSGALTATSDAAALADATESANLLASDLVASTSPFASELSTYLPGAATELADFFQSAAGFLSF